MLLARIHRPFPLSGFLPFDEVLQLEMPLQVAFATWAWKYLPADAFCSFYRQPGTPYLLCDICASNIATRGILVFVAGASHGRRKNAAPT